MSTVNPLDLFISELQSFELWFVALPAILVAQALRVAPALSCACSVQFLFGELSAEFAVTHFAAFAAQLQARGIESTTALTCPPSLVHG